MSAQPLAVQLGEFVAALRFDALPPEVVDRSRRSSTTAWTISMTGHGSARAVAARNAVLQQESLGTKKVGPGQGATLWVNGTRATRVGAIFANGVAIAADNRADSYRMLTHPGVLMIPAGVATAEGEGRNGRDLLTALAAGYEVQCRCARDFIPSTPAHGFRAVPSTAFSAAPRRRRS
jgi:2-methylcitrate dehydratase PrpD